MSVKWLGVIYAAFIIYDCIYNWKLRRRWLLCGIGV